MANWESEIRTKVLRARPYEAVADWGKMESLIDDSEGAVLPLFLKKSSLWSMGLAASLGLLLACLLTWQPWEKGVSPIPSAQLSQEIPSNNPSQIAPSLESSTEENISPYPSPSEQALPSAFLSTANRPSEKVEAASDSPSDQEIPTASVPNNQPFAYKINHISIENIWKGSKESLAPPAYISNELRIGPLLFLDSWQEHEESIADNSEPQFTTQKPKKWRVGVNLNGLVTPVAIREGVYAQANPRMIQSGFGLSLMRIINPSLTLGVKFDRDNIWYEVERSYQGFSDFLARSHDIRLRMMKYLRVKKHSNFQPYIELDGGLQYVNGQYIQVFQEQPYVNFEPAAQKALVVPQNPYNTYNVDYQFAEIGISAHEFYYWVQSAGLGMDIQIAKRLRLNIEAAVLGRIPFGFQQGYVAAPDLPQSGYPIYVKQMLGIQYEI